MKPVVVPIAGSPGAARIVIGATTAIDRPRAYGTPHAPALSPLTAQC
jgi:hypothetical protein